MEIIIETKGERLKDDNIRLFELVASILYYGEFTAETPNEKELLELLDRNGYWFDWNDPDSEEYLSDKLFGT